MRRIPAQALVTVLACCALWIAFGSQIVAGARKHDFLNLYTGASLALEGNFAQLHDPAVQLTRERIYVPDRTALVPFVRPNFYAAVLAPLALIPFAPAFWVWLGLQTAMLIGCWMWAFRRWGPDALIFGALYLPTALGIAHGQDCVLFLVVALAAYSLAERKQDLASGAVLAFGLVKFHLWLLWPVALILQKRWRILAGYATMAAAECGVSLLLGGTAGVQRYIELLHKKDLEHLNPSPELAINVHGLALNLGTSSWWLRGVLIALVIALVIAASRGPFWRAIAAASAGSLLIAPHVYGYDAGLLLLAVWLAIYCLTALPARLVATTLATPIPFMLTLAGKPWAAAAPLLILCFLITLALFAAARREHRV